MFQLPADADPGEAILAVVGLRPLLTGKPERIPADDWRDIGGIGKKCDELAKQLVEGTLSKASPPALDYEGSLDAFAEGLQPEQFEPIVKEFPAELGNEITDFVSAANRAWAYLEGKFPISVAKTVCGNVNLPPSDFALGMFEDLLEIVDKPLNVYVMVAVGRMTSDQALALETCYPSLYSRIVGSIVLQIIDAKAAAPKKDPWDCDFERGLAVLLNVPGLDPSIKTALALPADQQPQTSQAAQSRPPSKSPATQTATASQRVDNALQGG